MVMSCEYQSLKTPSAIIPSISHNVILLWKVMFVTAQQNRSYTKFSLSSQAREKFRVCVENSLCFLLSLSGTLGNQSLLLYISSQVQYLHKKSFQLTVSVV